MDVDAMKARLDVRYFGMSRRAQLLPGPWLTSHAAGVILCARHSKGRLTESFTTTSGTLVLRPLPGMSNTIGGGGALVAATRALALDLAPVRANCIMPGLVMTEMWEVRFNPTLIRGLRTKCGLTGWDACDVGNAEGDARGLREGAG